MATTTTTPAAAAAASSAVNGGSRTRSQPEEAAASKADASMEGSSDEAAGSECCPLFMDGLPSDFAANTGLAAIASLLEEEDGDDSKGGDIPQKKESYQSKVACKQGGGKATKKTGARKHHSPYSKQSPKGEKKKATMGEAQLFLNMWKI